MSAFDYEKNKEPSDALKKFDAFIGGEQQKRISDLERQLAAKDAEIERLKAELERLKADLRNAEYALAIYHHAYTSDNVPSSVAQGIATLAVQKAKIQED